MFPQKNLARKGLNMVADLTDVGHDRVYRIWK